MLAGDSSTEDEMVAVFLRGELDSSRFAGVRHVLTLFEISERIVTEPDLRDDTENALRRLMLFATRGYPVHGLFPGFPRDLQWQWHGLEQPDLERLQYINVPSWADDISGRTRTPTAGATYVTSHPHEEISIVCEAIANRLRSGDTLPPLILIGLPDMSRLVVLEGNARLTAMIMAADRLPLPQRAVCGVSPSAAQWQLF